MAAKKTAAKKAAAPAKKTVAKKAAAPARKATAKAAAPKRPATTAAKKAAPAGARRAAAKVSPVKGMPVDTWIAQRTSGFQTEVVNQLVSLIRAAEPEASVSIKWGQPVFDVNGPFAYIMPAKAHVTFGLWRGAELSDPKGLLSSGQRMTHMKLKSAGDIDKAGVTALVKQAARLNREKGNPTRRG